MKTATAKKPAVRLQHHADAEAYEAWYDEQVRLGLEDIDAGRVVSHDEFMRRSDARLKRLAR